MSDESKIKSTEQVEAEDASISEDELEQASGGSNTVHPVVEAGWDILAQAPFSGDDRGDDGRAVKRDDDSDG